MRLTEHHVAKVRREIADPGFLPVASNARPATDADYAAVVDGILAAAPPGDFWVFAYGSLIWNPDFDFDERRVALARGWRRAFCLGWDHRFRGSREAPGLMLALDRGGQCRGVVHRLPAAGLEANMHRLIRREMSMVPSAFPPRFIGVDTEAGRLAPSPSPSTATAAATSAGSTPRRSPTCCRPPVASAARWRSTCSPPSAISSNSASTTGICGACRNWSPSASNAWAEAAGRPACGGGLSGGRFGIA